MLIYVWHGPVEFGSSRLANQCSSSSSSRSIAEYCVILSGRGLQANFPFPLVPQQHERPELSPLLVDSVELLSLDIIFVVNSPTSVVVVYMKVLRHRSRATVLNYTAR